MIIVKCKDCNKEITSSKKPESCGCPNMLVVTGDSFTAKNLKKVIMLNNNTQKPDAKALTSEELAWQEQRRKRKVRKLDFEIR
tara:strand:- start:1881 stop:2129 length:249 start_codon:yes stop_codon:yes gene_type:complete